MVLATIFLILAAVLGFLATIQLKIKLYFVERMAWGIILGWVISTYLGFLTPPFLLLVLIIVLDLWLFYRVKSLISLDFSFERNTPAFLILCVAAVTFFAALYSTLWTDQPEGMALTSIGVWADWAMHLSLTNFFASHGFTLVNPLYAQGFLTYPFAADFFSGIIVRLGASAYFSFIIPGFVLSVCLAVLIFFFSFRLTKNPSASALVPFLFFANGGWSFNYVIEDLKKIDFNFLNFLTHIPREYAHLFEFGYQWGNVLVFFFMSQRPFLFGLPLGLIILTLVLERRLWLAGVFMGFLPVIHVHTFIVLAIVLPFLLIKDKKISHYLKVFLPAVFLSLPYFIWVILETRAIRSASFFSWSPGWLMGKENWFWFWTKNVGLLFPLIPLALLAPQINKTLKIFYGPFLGIFFLANLIGFQPNLADNNKIFIYWFLLSLILVSHFLTKTFPKILTALVVLSLTLTGILNILWFFEPQSHFLFLTNEELSFAQAVKKNTSVDSLILTSDRHNHPIPTFSGRRIVMGYRGWLWTYGINYGQREQEVAKMFAGDLNLLRQFGINYVVIGPSEKEKFPVNESFFEKNFPLVYQSQNYKIFQTSVYEAK